MAGFYARFQRSNGGWMPGDHFRNGQQWITLNGWEVAHPIILSQSREGRASASSVVGAIILFVRGLTASADLGKAVATGQRFLLVEVEAVEVHRGQELRYLSLRLTNAIITGVSRTSPAHQLPSVEQRVQVAYERIQWTYTPIPSQPVPPVDLLRLRG